MGELILKGKQDLSRSLVYLVTDEWPMKRYFLTNGVYMGDEPLAFDSYMYSTFLMDIKVFYTAEVKTAVQFFGSLPKRSSGWYEGITHFASGDSAVCWGNALRIITERENQGMIEINMKDNFDYLGSDSKSTSLCGLMTYKGKFFNLSEDLKLEVR